MPKKKATKAPVKYRVELEQEEDGRWLAEIPELPGVMVYGDSPAAATVAVKALAFRVLADRLDHGEAAPDLAGVAFVAA